MQSDNVSATITAGPSATITAGLSAAPGCSPTEQPRTNERMERNRTNERMERNRTNERMERNRTNERFVLHHISDNVGLHPGAAESAAVSPQTREGIIIYWDDLG